jgi:hypothetical protein
MPIKVRKVRNEKCWMVFNEITGKIHANCTSLAKAKTQKRLLDNLEMHGGMLPNNDNEIVNFAQWVVDNREHGRNPNTIGMLVAHFSMIPENELPPDILEVKRKYERWYDEFTAYGN